MKTNVTLHSKDRELFGVTIKQQTQNHFLSMTDLQTAYEKARWQYGWHEKHLPMIMQTKDFKERVYHLLYERDLIKVNILTFMEMVDREGITKVLKGLGVWKTTGRGTNKSVNSDPYIWVLLAMELNPMVYAKVVMWLTDSLIFDRLEAGSEFKPMNGAIKRVVERPDYRAYARAINENVFGFHQTGMRNLASAKELNRIADIEKFVINAINMKLIKSEEDILNVIKNYAR